MENSDRFRQLNEYLRQWEGRRRLGQALVWLPRGLLAGLLVAALVAALARFRPWLDNGQVGLVTLALGAAGLAVALVVQQGQRRTPLQQARFADRQFALQERASTAVEIQNGLLSAPPSLAVLQLDDALRAAARVDLARDLPLRWRRSDLLVLLAAILLLVAAVWLPNPQSDILRQRRAVAQAVDRQITALKALAEDIRQNPALTEDQQRELLEPVNEALAALEEGELSREEAVAVLSEAEADLRDLAARNNNQSLRDALAAAGRPLAENPLAGALGRQLQRGDLAGAAAAAASLADTVPDLSSSEQAELAADLAATAGALGGIDAELSAELAAAAEALAAGDTAGAQTALQEAAGTLQERAQQAAAAEQAGAAAGQLAEGRQSVAQAGSGAAPDSGTTAQSGSGSTPGTGQSPGSGEAAGATGGQGQGQGGGQNGDALGSGSGAGEPGGEGTGAGGTGPGGGHAESVYVPEFVDLHGEAGIDIELPAECRANPETCGGLLSERPTAIGDEQSLVPYDRVFGDYRDAAYEALSSDYIPLGYREYIRQYFSSLEPR